ECLALNRSITFEQLVKKIREANEKFWKDPILLRALLSDGYVFEDYEDRISAERIRNIFNGYTLTSDYIKNYRLVDQGDPDDAMNQYLDFVNHLIIVTKRANDESDDNTAKYELSLFGVILILAVVRSFHSNRGHHQLYHDMA